MMFLQLSLMLIAAVVCTFAHSDLDSFGGSDTFDTVENDANSSHFRDACVYLGYKPDTDRDFAACMNNFHSSAEQFLAQRQAELVHRLNNTRTLLNSYFHQPNDCSSDTSDSNDSQEDSATFERTIQRRISDSVNFDRDWDDYVMGFGDEDGNYWMGLEEIHQLTTTHNVSLFIDIETFEGQPFTMKLEEFSVGNATTNYAWNFSWFSQSSDRVKDSVLGSYHNGMMFSTRDRDNDMYRTNCASGLYRGGWWYNACAYINPNGDYEGDVTPTRTGILVKYIDTRSTSRSDTKAVKSVEMKIRTRV